MCTDLLSKRLNINAFSATSEKCETMCYPNYIVLFLSHRLIKQAPETEEVGGKVMIFPLDKLRS
jgi:hypothetical protein